MVEKKPCRVCLVFVLGVGAAVWACAAHYGGWWGIGLGWLPALFVVGMIVP
jgi:hypothetical protein